MLNSHDLDVAILPTHSPQQCHRGVLGLAEAKVRDQAPRSPEELEEAVQAACDIPPSVYHRRASAACSGMRERICPCAQTRPPVPACCTGSTTVPTYLSTFIAMMLRAPS